MVLSRVFGSLLKFPWLAFYWLEHSKQWFHNQHLLILIPRVPVGLFLLSVVPACPFSFNVSRFLACLIFFNDVLISTVFNKLYAIFP